MPATDSQDGQVQGTTPRSPVSAQPNGIANASAAANASAGEGTSTSTNTNNAESFKPGDIVGGSYEIIDQLGRGAMGMVYKAKHVSMTTEYAVKVLTTAQLNDLAVMRFQNEAQAIAKLNHPNIIAIYNFGLHDGRLPFYVMDLLVGDNLLDKLDAHGPMPVELALPVFIEVCAGLSYAHRKGIMHRDVKPANFVMLDAPDVRGAHVKVVDFGLVKFAEELKPDAQRLTAIGEVCGSPSYMSPEQSSGQKTDPRSDVYSLGCSLFQALTGKLPLLGRNATETMMLQHEQAAPTLTSKGDGRTYSENLELLVAKMLAKAPMDRYQTMDAVAQDLKNIMDNKALGAPQVVLSILDRGVGKAGSPLNTTTATTAGPANFAKSNDSVAASGGGASQSKGKSGVGHQASQDEPRPDTKTAKAIGLSILTMCLVGVILLLGWQFLHPVKMLSNAGQTMGGTGSRGGAVSAEAAAKAVLDDNFYRVPDLDETGPDEITTARYFARTISKQGKEYIEFDFPKIRKNQNIGMIAKSAAETYRIDGPMSFPKGSHLFLVPMPGLIKKPQFFEKFRPGEIAGICLSPESDGDQMFNYACRVPGIHSLNLQQCSQLTEAIVPTLSKLNLTVFVATASNIDGALLAKAHFWHNLQKLVLSKCKDVTPILRQLTGSRKLETLDLSGTELNAADYQLISNLPNLKYLDLSDDKLNIADLRALSRLPDLSEFIALSTKVQDGSMSEGLKHFHTLKHVVIGRGLINRKDRQLLGQECPNLKILEKSIGAVVNLEEILPP